MGEDYVEGMRPQGPAAIEAAHSLLQAFCWDDSAEGHDYWHRVFDRLHYIASLDKNYNYGAVNE